MAYSQVTPETLRRIASQIKSVSDAYFQLAADAENAGISTFDARGIETLFGTIERIEGNVNSIQKSLRDARRAKSQKSVTEELSQIPGVGTVSPQQERKADAEAAEDQARIERSNRRKKARKPAKPIDEEKKETG